MNTLCKDERLSGKRAVESLLTKGSWGNSPVLRYCWKPSGVEYSRILISVPKKNFKRAVKRNLLKRRIREAYRTQKELLGRCKADILFVYQLKEVVSSDSIRTEVGSILRAISDTAAE